MEPQKHGKILVAIDGSASSIDLVKYLSGIQAVRDKEVVLFSVCQGVPNYYDDVFGSAFLLTSGGGGSLAETYRKNMEEELGEKLEKVREVLLGIGFQERNVVVRLQRPDKGIARDIIAEAKNGYDLVVAGRKGVGRIERLFFGSVATKLAEKTTFAPLLLVGRDARPGKLLVAVDGSEGAGKVVEFLGRNLPGPGFEKITLLHVIRGDGSHHDSASREKLATLLALMESRLAVFGFDSGTLEHRIIENAGSRAETIVNHARSGGYGSIAIGRKGISNVPDFSMGRVCNKVIQMSRGLAVWVVR